VSPITLKVLQDNFRIDASGARSKSWEEFKHEYLDFVVSVSEQAEQTIHAFPDQPILSHWPYEDPAKVQGTAEQVEAAYFRVASRIRYRLQLFNNLSFDQLDRLRIEVKMKNLAQSTRTRIGWNESKSCRPWQLYCSGRRSRWCYTAFDRLPRVPFAERNSLTFSKSRTSRSGPQ
jgi:arsenate reductase